VSKKKSSTAEGSKVCNHDRPQEQWTGERPSAYPTVAVMIGS